MYSLETNIIAGLLFYIVGAYIVAVIARSSDKINREKIPNYYLTKIDMYAIYTIIALSWLTILGFIIMVLKAALSKK